MSPQSWFRVNVNSAIALASENEGWDGESYTEISLGAGGPNWGYGPSALNGSQVIDICSDHTYHFGRGSGSESFYPIGLPSKIGIWPAQGYIQLFITQPITWVLATFLI